MTKAELAAYNQTRTGTNHSVVCHAPFTNINFSQRGDMTACCFNRSHLLGIYPRTSVKEAWYGAAADTLRQYMIDANLGGGCKLCHLAIESGNYSGTKARYYDGYAHSIDYTKKAGLFQWFIKQSFKILPPKVFEFELSNVCNLECVMCDGYFSSSIRQNREHLPPLPNPYDDKFVDEIVEFLPGITDLKFLGGEPFLIDVYLKIWERVKAINPAINIHITTNGTVLNNRVKELLEGMRCGIVLSLDSLQPDVYAQIRVKGQLARVLQNMEYFLDYTQRKHTYFSIAVCPMQLNSSEMPALVDFANEKNVSIHFNTVWNPEEASLRFLRANELNQVIALYEKYQPTLGTDLHRENYARFTELTEQIKTWRNERAAMPPDLQDIHWAVNFNELSVDAINALPEATQKIVRIQLRALIKAEEHLFVAQLHLPSNIADPKAAFEQISVQQGHEKFFKNYLAAMRFLQPYTPFADIGFSQKMDDVMQIYAHSSIPETIVSDFIRTGMFFQIELISSQSASKLRDILYGRYHAA